MSGQPYKYFSDVNKYRTEYLNALNLTSELDNIKHEAVKNYKSTGTMPAISQMKDTRTTSEILADIYKVKLDIVGSISKISNSQFATSVVDTVMKNPLNTDNRLFVFLAQRVDDIVEQMRKLYKYGIKGDANDVRTFVNFID
jgi:hypothetical protein